SSDLKEGDILAEIETDKATMEFESFYEGTLLHIGVQEGETTKVDELLAIIGDEGEDISGLIEKSKKETKEIKKETSQAEVKEASAEPEKSNQQKAASSEIPDGVHVVTMPRLSDTMEEGTVATWLKKPGDTVKEGDILAEIETDKATMEFESFHAGTLLHVGLQEGESAKVDALLAIIGPKGTDVSDLAKNYTANTTKNNQAESTKQEVEKTSPKQEAPKVEVQPKQTQDANSPSGRIFASPLAKKMAEEKGINLSQIKGSGENGRIVKRDVENYSPAGVGAAVGKFVPSGQEDFDEKSNSQ